MLFELITIDHSAVAGLAGDSLGHWLHSFEPTLAQARTAAQIATTATIVNVERFIGINSETDIFTLLFFRSRSGIVNGIL